MTRGVALVRSLPLGTRVVVRYELKNNDAARPDTPGATLLRAETARFTDALGHIISRTDSHVTLQTRRGEASIEYALIRLAKEIPEAPERR